MFLAQPEDNNAVYRCEANNIMLKHPLQSQITLSVQCKLFVSSLGSWNAIYTSRDFSPLKIDFPHPNLVSLIC